MHFSIMIGEGSSTGSVIVACRLEMLFSFRQRLRKYICQIDISHLSTFM